MKKFSINLTQKQELFLASLLPKGCSFSLTKSTLKNTHVSEPQKNLKNQTETPNQKDLSSQDSNSQQSTPQSKSKDIHRGQSKKQIIQQKSIIKSEKTQNSQICQIKSQKFKLLDLLLDQIQMNKSASIFIEPVDPIKLKIPNYFEVIKQPMAIKTMRNKVKQGKYVNFLEFEHDLGKISSNCIKFNAGNNFFVQTAKKFLLEFKKTLQKYKQKIEIIFKVKQYDTPKGKPIQSNSQQQETNSQDQIQVKRKNVKFIDKQKEIKNKSKIKQLKNIKKKQQSEETKKIIQNHESPNTICEEKQEKIKKPFEQKECKQKLTQTIPDKKIQSTMESDQKRIQKKDKQEKEKTLQKVKEKKTIRIKKFSYEDRLVIISRIKKLDRSTMSQFFKEIDFSKGQSLDFKVLDDERIKQIEAKLRKFETLHQEKVQKIERFNKENGVSEDFEIEDDKDYDD